jgi:hypothetical protein
VNDLEFATQKARLGDLAAWWIHRIGLGWWNIDLVYVRADFEVDGKPAPDTVGCTSANWRYGHASISWNMPRVAEQSDADLEMCVVHELQHVFLSEARENGEDWLDHEERVASTYAKAFLWLRDELAGFRKTTTPELSAADADVGYAAHPPADRGAHPPADGYLRRQEAAR